MENISFEIKENPGEEVIAIAKQALNTYNIQSEYGESVDKGSLCPNKTAGKESRNKK